MSVFSCLFSFAFLTLALAWLSAGKDCKTLDGKWYNQLGDEISLKHGDNGTLLGEYRTKYAGEPHSAVLGEYIESVFNVLTHDVRSTSKLLLFACITVSKCHENGLFAGEP